MCYIRGEMGTLKPPTIPSLYMSPSDVSGSYGFSGFYQSWQALSEAAIAGMKATNKVMLAPIEASAAVTDGQRDASDLDRPPSIPSLEYERDDWTFERTVDNFENIGVGDSVRFTKQITDKDVRTFAAMTGDTNRLHLSDEYAETTRFGGRIAHGTLVSGMISAALARLPGLTIYLSQTVEFLGPVELGTTLTAVVEVVEDLGDSQYRLSTTIENQDGELVVDGEAVVLIDPIESEYDE